jgi:hypothetical protein
VATSDRGKAVRLRNGRGRYTLSPDTARRRDRAVQLRAEGWTYARIAEEVGYASAASALKAINAALAAIPQQSCEELVRSETARLEAIDAVLSEILARPPVKTTSIGRTQWDVRTCSCPTKARTDRDHDPDCQVQPVLAMEVVIAAAKERRQVGESLRRMRGADAQAGSPSVVIDLRRNTILLAEINADRALRGHPPMRSIPGVTE